MTTYAFVITATLFFVLGVITAYSYEAWQDGRYIAAQRRKAAAKRVIEKSFQAEVDAGTDDDMDRAVKLVEDELGGKPILNYGTNV